jgi:xanthine dehydrogenase YagS FAD-binding subunit
MTGPDGSRTVPAEKFHVKPSENVLRETVLMPGEIVTEIVLPYAHGLRSSYRKMRARASWDFALAGIALVLRFDGGVIAYARAVLSGAAPIPWRSREIEAAIMGAKLDANTIMKAAEAAVKNAQPLAKNDYKIPLFRGMIEEELAAIQKG